MLDHTESNNFSDTSDGLNHNISASVDQQSSYQRTYNKRFEPKKISGSKACDPITIVDDDEPDGTEIVYIDLETDNETHTKGENIVPSKEVMAETQSFRVQSVAKNPSLCNNTQGPDPARHTKRVTQPLSRALTKDEFPAPSVQSVSGTRGIGFKAWYGTHNSYHGGNTVPGISHTRRNPSIALYNEKHSKNTTMKDRDAPQFEMSVLNSKRKRTMGELGYDELISPAQVESPSEKLARMAKKRRQRQEKSDHGSQNVQSADTQCAMDLDHAYGHKNGSMTGEDVELIVSPIMYESLDRQETVARVGDERSGPSVDREPSPVGPCLSIQGHKDHPTPQRHEDLSNGHMDVYGFHSTQTIAQDRGAHPSKVVNDRQTTSGSVRVESQTTPMHMPDHTQIEISSPIAMRAPLLDSDTQEYTLSHLPEVRPTLKDDAASPSKNTQLDHPKSPVEHRATAGKGLSHDTLKRFQETGDWNRSMEVDQAPDEESEIPDVAYRYFVHKREWLETEEDAVESSMGPYHTMNEANAVAKAEVQSPQNDGFEGIRSKGWSYLYEQDEFGMQTHTATILEIHIEAAVYRGKCRFLRLVSPRR